MPSLLDIEKTINDTLTTYADTAEGGVSEEFLDEFMAEFEQVMKSLGEAEADKIDGYGSFVSKLTAEEDRLDIIIKNLQARKKSTASKIKGIKAHLLFTLDHFGVKRIKGNVFIATIRTSKFVLLDENIELPSEYTKTKVIIEPDKVMITEALKAGEEIDGASFQELKSVTIK